MIRRLTVTRAGADAATDTPVRLLAVSDEREPALDHEQNRSALGRIDGVIGAGDLDPGYLAFLADAFHVPLLHVLGNHDRGTGWQESHERLPEPIDGKWHDLAGLAVAGLSWPPTRHVHAVHDDGAAWRQVVASYLRFRRHRPDIVVSHVPPLGIGDAGEDDHYHRGFAAYRWLLKRIKPALWIHGHTTPASVREWLVEENGTKVVNVTGAVLIDMVPGAVRHASAPAVTSRIG
jgi:Icc-related predicted phosphoesterase